MKCRHCYSDLQHVVLDLGSAPPSNHYLTAATRHLPEKWFPLRVLVCETCWLVQVEDSLSPAELFSADYAYFSSYTLSWVQHAKDYVTAMVQRLNLNARSLVVEVAANDGYLLQHVAARGIPCLGIEPAAGTAAAARAKGLHIVEDFFTPKLARKLVAEGVVPDLIVANNVLAHVPDINDFTAAFAHLLAPGGVATFEFPHFHNLVKEHQIDTVYHEHFSYFSFTAVERVFLANGLAVCDVETLPTHGGSLRVYAQRQDTGAMDASPRVAALRDSERRAGVQTLDYYRGVQPAAERVKHDFLHFLLEAKRGGLRVGAYGAAAKGNTLLNFAGVRSDLLPWVVDRNPAKQGKCLPGSRIPIVDERVLRAERPDRIVILPWNLQAEIMAQLDYARAWGARFVTAVPEFHVL